MNVFAFRIKGGMGPVVVFPVQTEPTVKIAKINVIALLMWLVLNATKYLANANVHQVAMEFGVKPHAPEIAGVRGADTCASVCAAPPVLLSMAHVIVRLVGSVRCANNPVPRVGGVRGVSVSVAVVTLLIVIDSLVIVNARLDIQVKGVKKVSQMFSNAFCLTCNS